MASKAHILILFVASALLLGARSARAENVTSSARIVVPLVATSGTALRFGNIAASTTAGTVTVTAGGARTAAGGAALVAGAAVGAGVVTITSGEGNRVVNITYPASGTLVSGPNTMTVNNFAASGSPATVTLSAAGTGTFNVGGRVAVGVSQPTGNYSGTVTITLTYQ